MSRIKFILDPKFGGTIRLVIQVLTYVTAVIAALQKNAEVAGGVLSLPLILSTLAHRTEIGNKE